MIVALASVLFAVSNRDSVSVSVWPFPFAIDLGLYVIVLISVLSGFLVGALTSWVAAGKHRRRVRRQRTEIRTMESEINSLRTRLDAATTKASESPMDEAA